MPTLLPRSERRRIAKEKGVDFISIPYYMGKGEFYNPNTRAINVMPEIDGVTTPRKDDKQNDESC